MFIRSKSVVIDIMEARRIGSEILSNHGLNCIVIKFEILDYRGRVTEPNLTQYQAVFESKGWRKNRWIDNYNMIKFPFPYGQFY